jgi:hypothetical protein
MTQYWESKPNDKQNLVFRGQCVLKRNDLKPNLAFFQKFLLLHCQPSPQQGEGAGGSPEGRRTGKGIKYGRERGVGKKT